MIQFSKYCDINPSYSATYEEKRFCEFKIPISWFDPPLGCVYIICQNTNEVYVGKAHHLGERFHSYDSSWKWDSTNIETDHDANINKKILAGVETGHCFELWISVFKDESARTVIEKNIIRNHRPAWNNMMYDGDEKKRYPSTPCPKCGFAEWFCRGTFCQGSKQLYVEEVYPYHSGKVLLHEHDVDRIQQFDGKRSISNQIIEYFRKRMTRKWGGGE